MALSPLLLFNRARNLSQASARCPSSVNENTSVENHGSRNRRTALQEKSRRFPTNRCVGRIVKPSLLVFMNVIIEHSYGASGINFPARVLDSFRKFSEVS